MSGEIKHVTDTALWVASHRALESARPDAVFHDPLAAVLAGERGLAIARSMPHSSLMSWVMVLRTSAIDRLVLSAIERGADVVLNLGAGLDTRPYRMALPPTLRWIEADFPDMIELKSTKLAAEKPVCQLERVGIDLSNRTLRQAFLRQIGAEAKCVLVISEGLLIYLESRDVAELGEDLLAVPNFKYWIQDYYHGKRRVPRSWRKNLKAAPMRFEVTDWFQFFEPLGWQPLEDITLIEEATRLKRPPPFMFPMSLLFPLLSRKRREKLAKSSGYVLMERKR